MARQILDIGVLIVYLAILATLLAHKTTGEDINAIGGAFNKSIEAAKGEK